VRAQRHGGRYWSQAGYRWQLGPNAFRAPDLLGVRPTIEQRLVRPDRLVVMDERRVWFLFWSGYSMSAMTARDATLALLRSLGMTTVFGNPGSTELGFLADWPKDFRYVMGLQESAVVAMADGFAQATGTAACVNLHSAAGTGHALGSIFTAYRNQTPLVITAGQQSRALLPFRPFLGASSATEFPKPYVKWSCEPARAEDVPVAIAEAHCLAMQRPRGPTFVSIPADDWSRDAELLSVFPKSQECAPEPQLLSELARRLNNSSTPGLVVGAGVARDDATEFVVTLATRLQAPVWTAPLASRAAFPEDHPLFSGFLPAAPEPLYRTLSRCDVVLVLGAPAFTFHIPGALRPAPGSPAIYQIADDPEVLATAVGAAGILGSTRLAAVELLKHVSPRAGAMPRRRESHRRLSPSDPIPAAFVLQTIAELRPPGSIIVEEAPSHKAALQRYLPIRDGNFYATASGGLGFGMPAAAGLALGSPDRHVICIVGDGSAMYSIQTLWTAARYNLPVTYVVLNNRGYGAMRAFSQLTGNASLPDIDLCLLDFQHLAQGHGCTGSRVTDTSQLASSLSAAFSSARPTVIDVAVDPSVETLFGPE
jgi:benzoylformate decarboxylase